MVLFSGTIISFESIIVLFLGDISLSIFIQDEDESSDLRLTELKFEIDHHLLEFINGYRPFILIIAGPKECFWSKSFPV